MTKPPTIADVARLSGVSRQTVSNAINSPERLKASTLEKVSAAIEQLGYRPNLGARRLRTQKSSTIAVRLDPYTGGISGAVLDRFVHALTEQATEHGRRILVYAADNQETELNQLAALADGGEIDSAVLTGTFPGDIRPAWLKQQRLDFVTFGRPWGTDDFENPSHSWVDVDGAVGAAQATADAVKRFGPNIHFLGWPAGSATGEERSNGWRQALVKLGLPCGASLVAEDRTAVARQVVSAWINEGIALDGLVCASDSLAVGAKLALIDSGLAGVGVYGFDNTPTAEALGLSSVEQEPEQVAAGVFSLLLADPSKPNYVLIEPTLVVR